MGKPKSKKTRTRKHTGQKQKQRQTVNVHVGSGGQSAPSQVRIMPFPMPTMPASQAPASLSLNIPFQNPMGIIGIPPLTNGTEPPKPIQINQTIANAPSVSDIPANIPSVPKRQEKGPIVPTLPMAPPAQELAVQTQPEVAEMSAQTDKRTSSDESGPSDTRRLQELAFERDLVGLDKSALWGKYEDSIKAAVGKTFKKTNHGQMVNAIMAGVRSGSINIPDKYKK